MFTPHARNVMRRITVTGITGLTLFTLAVPANAVTPPADNDWNLTSNAGTSLTDATASTLDGTQTTADTDTTSGTPIDITTIGTVTLNPIQDSKGQTLTKANAFGGTNAIFPLSIHISDTSKLTEGTQISIPFSTDWEQGTGHFITPSLNVDSTIKTNDGTQVFTLSADNTNHRLLLTATKTTKDYQTLDLNVKTNGALYPALGGLGIIANRNAYTATKTVFTFAGSTQTVENDPVEMKATYSNYTEIDQSNSSTNTASIYMETYFHDLINKGGNLTDADRQVIDQPFGYLMHIQTNSSPLKFKTVNFRSGSNLSVDGVKTSNMPYRQDSISQLFSFLKTADVKPQMFDSVEDMIKLVPANSIARRTNADGSLDVAIVFAAPKDLPRTAASDEANRDELTERMLKTMGENGIPFGWSQTFLKFQWDTGVNDQSATVTTTSIRGGVASQPVTTTLTNTPMSNSATGVKQSWLAYQPNGGTGSMSTVVGEVGSNVTIESDKFTRSGYSFTDWNTKTDGSGVTYKPGDTTKITDEGLTLFAQWAADKATVTYDPNATDATGTTAATNGATDQTVKTSMNGYARPGYTFTGWNTKPDGSGDAYAENADLKIPAGGLTLYAQWTAAKASVRYHANNGEGVMQDTEGVNGQSVNVSENTFTRTGYVFTGWNTKPDGSGDKVPDKGTVTIPADGVDLYAQWSPITYTVSYKPGDGGTGTMTDQTLTYDQPVTLTANGFTKPGYTFTGWTDQNGNTYTDGQQVSNLTSKDGDTITLTAQWTPVTVNPVRVTVSYDANGGTGGMTPTTIDKDGTIQLPDPTFTYDQHRFAGWNTAKDGSGTAYQPGDALTVDRDLTLYAQWTVDDTTPDQPTDQPTTPDDTPTGTPDETPTTPTETPDDTPTTTPTDNMSTTPTDTQPATTQANNDDDDRKLAQTGATMPFTWLTGLPILLLGWILGRRHDTNQ